MKNLNLIDYCFRFWEKSTSYINDPLWQIQEFHCLSGISVFHCSAMDQTWCFHTYKFIHQISPKYVYMKLPLQEYIPNFVVFVNESICMKMSRLVHHTVESQLLVCMYMMKYIIYFFMASSIILSSKAWITSINPPTGQRHRVSQPEHFLSYTSCGSPPGVNDGWHTELHC